jgi:predicted SAM-dependent methyltransferase
MDALASSIQNTSLEHLDYPSDALNFLSESHRILERGGRFSVGVPDTEEALLEYAGKNTGWLKPPGVAKGERRRP